MDQTGQTSLHFEPEHDPFIKWVSCVGLNMTRTHLASIHDLFINGLVISNSRVVSNLPSLRIRYKAHVLHYSIRDCHIKFLLKT